MAARAAVRPGPAVDRRAGLRAVAGTPAGDQPGLDRAGRARAQPVRATARTTVAGSRWSRSSSTYSCWPPGRWSSLSSWPEPERRTLTAALSQLTCHREFDKVRSVPPTPVTAHPISRRGILVASGAAGTALLPGGTPPAFAARPGRRVAVMGGGMAGLTAAHELAERGFQVTVYEPSAWGGKARSIPVPGTGRGGRRDLPGEHGFRFFPGFYHHVPNTMRGSRPGRHRGRQPGRRDRREVPARRRPRRRIHLRDRARPGAGAHRRRPAPAT